jgi:hypothetical protein
VIIGIVALIATLWVIIDVFSSGKKLSTMEKAVWTVFALLFSIVTAIVYYFMKKK